MKSRKTKRTLRLFLLIKIKKTGHFIYDALYLKKMQKLFLEEKMKKILILWLISLFVLLFISCGDDSPRPLTVDKVEPESLEDYEIPEQGELPPNKEKVLGALEGRNYALLAGMITLYQNPELASLMTNLSGEESTTRTLNVYDNLDENGTALIDFSDEELSLTDGSLIIDGSLDINQDSSDPAVERNNLSSDLTIDLVDYQYTNRSGTITVTMNGKLNLAFKAQSSDDGTTANISGELAYAEGYSISGSYHGKIIMYCYATINIKTDSATLSQENPDQTEIQALILNGLSINGTIEVYNNENALQGSYAFTKDDIQEIMEDLEQQMQDSE